jgi:hypothetical protein
LSIGINALIRDVGLTPAPAISAATTHTAQILQSPEPTLEAGQPANLGRFRLRLGEEGPRFELLDTAVDWAWTDPAEPRN